MADLPTDLTYGKVVGRFLTAVGDSADAGSNPDAVVPAGLVVKFTPKASLIRATSPSALIVPKAVTCTVNSSGDLLDPQGAEGVWLVAGIYSVAYQASDFAIASHDVEVLAAHTAGAPLDLALAAPPPVPVTTTQYAQLDARLQVVESSGGGGGGGGVTDHGALTGLGDDDHAQYLTNARGDVRYYTKGANDTLLAGKAATSHGHAIADVSGLQSALDAKQAAGSYAAATHTHTAAQVSDSTATGRALLTAADAAAARTAIAAGTSSFSGSYGDLTGKPTLGTAAATAAADYATAAQGAKADTAVQPSALTSGLAGKADTAHTHDDRYYSETEADARFVRTVNGTAPNASGNVTVAGEPGPAGVSDVVFAVGTTGEDVPAGTPANTLVVLRAAP